MSNSRKIRSIAAGIFASGALILSGAAAHAEEKANTSEGFVKRGTLTCDIDAGIGLIVGSSKSLQCSFQIDGQKTPEIYSGSIDKLGLDIGVTAKSKVVWAVYALPKTKLKGQLAGTYSGLSAELTAGLGLGAKTLVGSKKEIALAPLSLDGQTGLNVAVGIASVKLTTGE